MPPPTSREDRRMLDLSHLLQSNASGVTVARNLSELNASAARNFQAKWSAVVAQRKQLPPGPPPGPGAGGSQLNGSEVWSVLEAALPRSVFVYPLSAKACADVDNCVGTVAATGDCVCDQLDRSQEQMN